jgi:uncharacterized Rmd1/YagE family protein
MPLKDKKKRALYCRDYYIKNREKRLAQGHMYYIENREKRKASAREYYIENREKQNARRKEHYMNNREHALEKAREYRLNNRDYVLEKNKEYYMNNKEKVYENKRVWSIIQQAETCINDHKRRGIIITEEEWFLAADVPFCFICEHPWNDFEWSDRMGKRTGPVFEEHYRAFVHNHCNIAKGPFTIDEFHQWGKDAFGSKELEAELARVKESEGEKDAMCTHITAELEQALVDNAKLRAEVVRLKVENEKLYYDTPTPAQRAASAA